MQNGPRGNRLRGGRLFDKRRGGIRGRKLTERRITKKEERERLGRGKASSNSYNHQGGKTRSEGRLFP